MTTTEINYGLLPRDDPRHGTENAYQNHECRCPECRVAHTQYQYADTQRRKARGLPPDDPRHGTTNGYSNWGCRCPRCTGAFRDYDARRRK